MEPEHVDVAVVGLGSAGENLVGTLAEAGRSVVGFEPHRVGGECPFTACMPSKVLLHHAAMDEPDWDEARRHRDEVVNGLDDSGHHDELVDAGVDVVRERATVVGECRVRAGEREWTADTVVLATGSQAVVPPIDGLDRDRIWTSADLMTTDELPASCIIMGGGVIGCESAALLVGFGSNVTLIERGESLLPGLVAPEVAERLGERLIDLGVDVRLGGEVERVAHGSPTGTDDDEVWIDGGGSVSGERVLVAVGQAPNWGGLGLDSIGLDDLDDADVDGDHVVTGLGWLRAIGDLDGRAPWTHGANHEAARLAAMLLGGPIPAPEHDMANGVFTDPPVASVGLTAEAARDAGHDVLTGIARYSDTARFSTDRTFDGIVVVVADRATRRILGCSGIGPRFDDTISVVSALMHGGVDIDRARHHVIPFPTMSQVLTPAFERAAAAT